MEKQLKHKLNLQFFSNDDPDPQEPNPKEPEPKEPGDDPNNIDPKEKTYTESELKKIIQDRVAREKKATEKAVAEAEKLAKMNADEKREHERQKLEEELAEYKRKDQFYSLSKEASKMLSEHNIHADDELLSFVVKDDAESTQEAVNTFVSMFNEKVEEGVKQALSGNSPRVNAGNNVVSKKQIMEIKDPVERQKAIRENINLFN